MTYRFSPWCVLMECATPEPWPVLVEQSEAEAFVTDAVRDLLRIMGNASLTPSGRATAFAKAIGRLTDIGHVTDLILGERASGLTPAQRQSFAATFGACVGRAYDGRLWLGAVDDMTLLGSTTPDSDEVVVSLMIRNTPAFAPLPMSWRVLRSAGGWRLIDIEYRGTWLVDAHRWDEQGRE
jgi:phospholipid transport system substrate-binding protein